jgi:hypothetical protein
VDQSITQPRGAVDLDPVVSSEFVDPLLKVDEVLRSTCDLPVRANQSLPARGQPPRVSRGPRTAAWAACPSPASRS